MVENRDPIFKFEDGQGPIDKVSSSKLGIVHNNFIPLSTISISKTPSMNVKSGSIKGLL